MPDTKRNTEGVLFARWFELENLQALLHTALVAILGGVAGSLIGLPAPWLSGPSATCALASIAGMKIGVPLGLREAALLLLGLSMGASVRPETLALMAKWPLALGMLAICVPAIMLAISLYLERVHRFDRATARLCAVPGALPFVLATAAATTGDIKRVMIVQLFRVVVIATCLPSLVKFLGGPVAAPAVVVAGPVSALELAVLVVLGLAAAWLLTVLKFPAAAMFGAMIASVAAFASGLITTAIPPWLVLPGTIIVGAMSGASFGAADRGLIVRTLPAALGALAVGAGVGLAFAVPVAFALGLPVAQIWLAYAPGGVESMAIMALALGLDPAFVGAHHVARFLGLGLGVPVWMRDHLGGAKSDDPGGASG